MVPTLRLFKRHHMNMLHVVLAALVLTWLGFQTVRAAVTPCEALRHSAIQAVRWLALVGRGRRRRHPSVPLSRAALSNKEIGTDQQVRAIPLASQGC